MYNNPFSIKDKNILITGASSGIGRQCAISCSQMGANVILLARREDKLKETLSMCAHGNHLHYPLDITEFDKLESVVNESVEKIGRISGYIHSAGIELTLPVKMLKPEHYSKMFNINVISGFHIANLLANKKNISDSGASFVFLSSIMSITGQIGKIAYCSSKGAVNAGVRAMALEFSNKKIRVNSISPAIVDTDMNEKLFSSITEESKKVIIDMHPLGIGSSSDIANVCIFLLSEASRWITGANMIVDGGYSIK
jgi:NAD(P)-dependent dehydrogenase (short-subunit alcohol dehydrogenase family)